jgi:hypothetical protein
MCHARKGYNVRRLIATALLLSTSRRDANEALLPELIR